MEKELATLTDTELYCLFKDNNSLAFEAIFDKYWKRLYGYAYRIYQDEPICEDIVQEVFISLWEKLSNTEILHLEGYLFRAVKYKIANHIRDLKFTDLHEKIILEIPHSSAASRNMEFQEFEGHIKNLIDKLPPKCREVFTLSRYEQLSNMEIAEKLDLSIRTVETHISKALKFLKSNIDASHISIIITTMFLER
ncbi:RNA polymerase sigma-70 factor [Gillisia sp. M10.2A]|uniref:RNA polymerase sigma-70 factor n=1 Tax=Gillisia lutea TaxID=2909668 RepID=A0ABS9EG84_9FLAO|nr:RNA polymerase sigma-70 factor [Gillisia lutea]MCF4100785.1 RNA polymerase sigma-70 factor [Gillisia lutea]